MPIVLAEPSEELLHAAAEQAAVYEQYIALTAAATLDSTSGLGGKLLFAGDLARNSDLLRAANIAGAASLAVSDSLAAGREAMRNGVIDFLVTSLDEALRILKNELRKQQPVSVSVEASPDRIVQQMVERGVLPDLLAAFACGVEEERRFLDQGSSGLSAVPSTDRKYMTWSVSQSGRQCLAQIDSFARELFAEGELARERWLRLAPRYLGRVAQRQHGVLLTLLEAEKLLIRVEELVAASSSDAGEPVVVMLAQPA
jgi:hypothetical protein